MVKVLGGDMGHFGSASRGEVESMSRDMSSGNGLSNLKLYLNLIGQEVERIRWEPHGLVEMDRLSSSGMKLRSQFVTPMEGAYHRLTRIIGRQ